MKKTFKLAYDALIDLGAEDYEGFGDVLDALEEALAQPEQEPVAHFGSAYVNENGVHVTTVLGPVAIPQDAKLYTTPPQPKELEQEPWLLETTQTLAKHMAREFYPEVTQWECLDNLAGVISQIDNMTTGLMRKPEQEPVAWPIETNNQVEALAKRCGWDNRRYMTPEDYQIWCDRMRQFVQLATPPQPKEPEQEPFGYLLDGVFYEVMQFHFQGGAWEGQIPVYTTPYVATPRPQPEQEPVDCLECKRLENELERANIKATVWKSAYDVEVGCNDQEKERCVGCEACIDTACGRDECPKGWPKAAQPEQERVAWLVYAKGSRRYFTLTFDVEKVPEIYKGGEAVPLYTTPPQRKPLTDEHPLMVFAKECALGAYQEYELADAANKAIEAADKILKE